MKHKLLFLFLIFIVPIKKYAQQTIPPPPPCGITDLIGCDEDGDSLALFDLTIYDDIYPYCFIPSTSASDYYPPTHHLTQEDADTGANPIANPESFQGYDGQPIFLRAEPINAGIDPLLSFESYGLTMVNSCSDPSFALALTCDGAIVTITGDSGGVFTFNPVPADGAIIDPITGTVVGGTPGVTYCITYTLPGIEAISSTECFTVLPLEDASFIMTPTCDGATAFVTGEVGGTFNFFPAPNDNAVINPVTGEVTNVTPGALYVVEYTTSGPCPTSYLITFIIPNPIENEPSSIMLCDDATSDGFTVFDLTAVEMEITGGDTNTAVNYFESLSDAENNINPIANPSAYTNTTNPQTIYVGVDDTECYGTTEFTLTVIGVPSIPVALTVCDYVNENDGIAIFDLSLATPQILNGLNPNDSSVTYYETSEDAESGVNALPNSYTNTVPFAQTIYAQWFDFNSGCLAVIPVDLSVQYCPISCGEIVNIDYCYTDDDTTEFIFSSEDGLPLTLIFNSGQLEDGFDAISIIDSDGTTELYNGFGTNGNIAGYSFTSSGGSILVRLNTNESNSCSNQDFDNLNFDVYCSNSLGVIQLNAFLDANENGVFDAGEMLFNNGTFSYEINNNGNVFNVSTSSGSYSITNFNPANSYDISFEPFNDFQTCLSQTLTSFEDITVANGNTVEINFPLVEFDTCDDIAVSLISYNPPRPGLLNVIRLNITNYGDVSVSGSVDFVYDDFLTLVDVGFLSPGNTIDYTSNGFTLYFNNLLPGEQEFVFIDLYVPTTAQMGQLVTHSVTYSVDDLDLENNYFELTETVVNSYDPNDKMEAHGREIVFDDFTSDDYLFYTIRFQNLGTAPALNIRIEDVLDAQLDPSTFKMLDASHDYSVERVGSNLTWYFNNINLPHESMDEEGSNGYIVFRIKPNTGYQVGDIIPNYADIYFDFNPAITTNTYETEFVSPLSTGDFTFDKIKVYPNPVNSIINIQTESSNEALTVQIIDLQGKLIMNQNLEGTSMDVSQLNPGVYFLKVKDENSYIKTFKVIKE